MKLIDSIREFIANLDQKKFFTYLLATLGALLCMVGFTVYFFYARIGSWRKEIKNINNARDEIRIIIARDEKVQQQRQEINKMLEEEPDFLIEGYFNEVTNAMGLDRHKLQEPNITKADRGDPEYQEVLLSAKFDTLNMRQLTELLDAIEQNKRIYTKELEISKSKKMPNTIDVNLTIATLQRKPELTENIE